MSKYPQALKPKKISTDRYDNRGEIKKMCEAEGYVMVRRSGCAPFVLPLGAWERTAKYACFMHDQFSLKETRHEDERGAD